MTEKLCSRKQALLNVKQAYSHFTWMIFDRSIGKVLEFMKSSMNSRGDSNGKN